MGSNPKVNPNHMEVLLQAVSKKLGIPASQLRQDLEAGKFDSAMKNMSQKDAAKFQQVVNNPKIVEKLMNAPQAKALYEKLTGEKK